MTLDASVGESVRLDRPEKLAEVPTYVWLFLAGFVFAMFSGNAGYIGLPLSLDRPLFLLGALLLLLDHRTERLRPRAVYVVMVAAVLWTSYSWLDTGFLRESAKAFALADRIALPFVMFALGPLVFSTQTRRDLLLKFLTLLGVYLALTGIFEFAGLDELVWPRYISDPALGIQQGRARGPFLSSEPFGMMNGLVIFAAGLLATRVRGLWRLVAVLTVVACVCGVAVSLTRTVWLSTTVGVLVVAWVAPQLRRWLPVALPGALAVGAGVLAALPAVYAQMTDRLTTENSVYDRLNTNAAGLRIMDAHPLTGVGWGNFRSVASDWIRQADTYPLANSDIEIHNVLLSRAAETGVIGAALWLLAMLLGPVRAILGAPTSDSEGLGWKLVGAGGLFIWLGPTLTSPNPYPLPNLLVWLLAGIAGRGYLVAARPPAPPSRAVEATPR